jgi:outer membrane autotransporter protein
MNKIYRIVWNEARHAFVVANENSKAKGKPSAKRKVVASAVIMALAALAAEPALAASSCIGGGVLQTVSGSDTSVCIFSAGDRLDVSGSIIVNAVNGAVDLQGITDAVSITNSGIIQNDNLSNGSGISLVSSWITNGITNSGTISGGAHGISVDVNSTILGATGILIRSLGSVSGGINNDGRIEGAATGINLTTNSTITGGITNGGKISGGLKGVNILSSVLSGGINNIGTISGQNYGIKVDLTSEIIGGINNSGIIFGGQYAIYVDSTSSLDGITITGANTAAFSGDVFAQNTPVTILAGSTFTGTNAFDVQSFNIESGALFNMTGMPSLASGTAGITTSQGVNNAGTLSVAESVTGHITGNYTQSSSGVLQVGASSTSNFGKLVVTGTATLPVNANIVVNVNSTNLFGTGGGKLAGVISAGTLVSNGFHITDNSVLIDFISVKNNNQVDLFAVVPGGVLANVSALGNNTAMGAATVLENLLSLRTSNGTTGNAEMDLAIDKLISNSTSQQNVSNAVSQTLPLLMGGETAAITGTLHSLNHIVQSRLEGQQGLSSGDTYYEDGRAWVKPFGSSAKQGDDQGISGYSALTSGLVFGADTNIERSNRAGAALTLANTNVSGNSTIAPQSSNVATYQLTLYGSQSLGDATEVNAHAGLGDHYSRGLRSIVFAGSTAQSSYHSISGQLGVGIAHALLLGEVTTFTPSLRFDYTTVHGDTYLETGAGGLDLNVDKNIVNEMLISADGKITRKVGEHFILTGNVGVGYDTLAKEGSINTAFAGDPAATSFTTPGLSPSRLQTRGGFGIIRIQSDIEFTIRYDVDTRASHFIDQTLSAKCRWLF